MCVCVYGTCLVLFTPSIRLDTTRGSFLYSGSTLMSAGSADIWWLGGRGGGGEEYIPLLPGHTPYPATKAHHFTSLITAFSPVSVNTSIPVSPT